MPRPRFDVARPAAGPRRGRAGLGRPIQRRQNGQGKKVSRPNLVIKSNLK